VTKKRILELMPLMPNDAPYFQGGAPKPGMSIGEWRHAFVEKYARCISDPAFGWHFVESFIVTGRAYPLGAFDRPLLQTYYWHTQKSYYDRSIVEAKAIALPQSQIRDVLEAMLLIPKLKLGEICRELAISLSALRTYTELFFNVVDRRNEPDYIRQLVYPETRRVLLKENYLDQVSTTYLLRRVAYEHGLEALQYVAGFRSTYGQGIPAAEAAKRLESEILRMANFVLALGGANSKAPVLKHARALASSRRRADSDPKSGVGLGLDGMAIDSAIGEHLLRAIAPDPLQLLQRRIDEETAAAAS
jgi:hypothetical protein